jgi:hypothetical protein
MHSWKREVWHDVAKSQRAEEFSLSRLEIPEHAGVMNPTAGVCIYKPDPGFEDKGLHQPMLESPQLMLGEYNFQ